jgi:predicted ATP-grasp superfamily ATP-dependent carboligase
MALYRLTDEAPPNASVLIQALSGWVDAGRAGTAAAAFLSGTSRVVAKFDADSLVDYRSNRPILDFVDGEIREIQWPAIEVRHSSSSGRDLLILNGVEPDLRWREFSSSVHDLATRAGVTKLISIGAIPAAVPHTLESPVMMTASDKSLLEGQRVPEGILRVPSAAVSAVDHLFVERGLQTVGFWAQVPHYVTDDYQPAVLSLVAKVTGHLGLDLELDELRSRAEEQRAGLDEVVASRPEAKSYVERLESMASTEFGLGDQLASDVERFLREVGGDNPFDR